jgi:PEP-CTERM motif
MKINLLLMRAAAITLALVPCFASTIDLGINGDAQVGPTFINFGNYPSGTVYTPAPGYGVIVISQPPLGVFLSGGVTAGESGRIQSLNALTTPPGVILTPDPTSALPFITFDTTGSNLKVFLTELVPGFTAGPFTLSDTQNGAIASFNMDGFVYDMTNNSSEAITGTFSATFNGMTVADLIAAGSGPGIETPFSGTLSITAVPEPASEMLFGMALLGTGLILKRRRSAAFVVMSTK